LNSIQLPSHNFGNLTIAQLRTRAMPSPEDSSANILEQLRSLSHRMSNALEVIMQAQYLLQQSRASGNAPGEEKWTTMIGNAVTEAAETNRELRDTIRSLSAMQAAKAADAKLSVRLSPKANRKNANPLR
jgi:two-component sensor histidine kinase